MKKVGIFLVLLVASQLFAQHSRTSVFIEPQHGFETYLAAAMRLNGANHSTLRKKGGRLRAATPILGTPLYPK